MPDRNALDFGGNIDFRGTQAWRGREQHCCDATEKNLCGFHCVLSGKPGPVWLYVAAVSGSLLAPGFTWALLVYSDR